MNIVITGSTRGIGRGLAEYFLKQGCKVIINGTSSNSVQPAVEELSKDYINCVYGVVGNVSQYDAVENLWEKAVRKLGQVDIWINNAGIDQERELFMDINIDRASRLIDINVKGVMNGSHIALKHMLQQGFGQIYNMEGFGSDGRILPKMSVYGTSKTAVTYFTRSLAKEVKESGLIIGRLSPGMVVTDLLKESISKGTKEAEKNKRIFNILADDVSTVTHYLGKRILKNTKNNTHIKWLTGPKILYRFIKAPFSKRDLFKG